MPIQAIAGIAAKKAAKRAARRAARRSAKKSKKGAQATVKDDRPELMSAEGVAMMTTALLFDFVPPAMVLALNLLFGLGELLSWPLDILATMMLGGWMWARGGKMPFRKKSTQFLKKRGLFIFLEYVPIVGSIGPWWTFNVFMFLKK